MSFRVFSIVGEALHFGARRMETIMRLAWLPVTLMLLFSLVQMFGVVSIAAERLVTFEQAVPSVGALQKIYAQALTVGFLKAPQAIVLILVVGSILQLILSASFMAPLIRLAGLNEMPRAGILHLPFGADQLRFCVAQVLTLAISGLLIFAPLAMTFLYVSQYLAEAFSQTMAHFPNDQSLHTIETMTGEEAFAKRGTSWLYLYALPLGVALPFFIAIWLFISRHMGGHQLRASGTDSPLVRRAAISFIATLLLGGFLIWLVAGMMGGNLGANELGTQILLVVLLMLFGYMQLRLAPYSGVAVCQGSLRPGTTLHITRGYNILRLLAIFGLMTVLLLVFQYVINSIVLRQWIGWTVTALFQTTTAYTKVFNGGEAAGWVYPVFLWSWNLIKIAINIFWTFFASGVTAGLLGRLYRESLKG